MNSVDSFIGRRIRQFRWVCGVTQAELAEHLSVDPGQISAYEAGTNRVAAAQLLQIATVLDIPVASFFDGIAAPSGADQNGPPKTIGSNRAEMLSHFNEMTDPQQVALLKMAQTMATHLGNLATPAQSANDLQSATATERQR
ncbi:XRE family transcriptional regulator [Pseudotabrizicola sediminis]|uniref:XRE family transcriptional regulator n=1 Tax=Pseudotabrizicola sediminis TaxID=2486418 RepID=A0ABY2KSB2_9RHOB|nr:helix-turn-helix transcriptional regulator [Pseudotabrizicola sediminis]TGD43917.1 XRE family transcriptional regulator [Pseudotabrizicola sediminis]